MKRLLLVCVLMAALGVALAQKGRSTITQTGQSGISQHNINVPDALQVHPVGQLGIGRRYLCPDITAPLLDVIRELTDQASVDNELKFESDNQLTSDNIYERRMQIIKAGIDQLKKPRSKR